MHILGWFLNAGFLHVWVFLHCCMLLLMESELARQWPSWKHPEKPVCVHLHQVLDLVCVPVLVQLADSDNDCGIPASFLGQMPASSLNLQHAAARTVKSWGHDWHVQPGWLILVRKSDAQDVTQSAASTHTTAFWTWQTCSQNALETDLHLLHWESKRTKAIRWTTVLYVLVRLLILYQDGKLHVKLKHA